MRKKILIIGVSAAVLGLAIYAVYRLFFYESPARVPANTLVACYVDCERAYRNLDEVADMVVDRLQGKLRRESDDQLKKFREFCEDQIVCYKPRWACLLVGTNSKTKGLDNVFEEPPSAALVVRCNPTAKDKRGRTLEECLKAVWRENGEYDSDYYKRSQEVSTDTLEGEPLLELKIVSKNRRYGDDDSTNSNKPKWETREQVTATVAFVGERYLIAVAQEDRDYLRSLIKFYRDGEGEESTSFADISDLPNASIARVRTCNVGAIADILDLREKIERVARACEDEALAEEFFKLGDLTYDLKVGPSKLGGEISLDAGSKEMAKVLEGVCNIGLFANRLFCDVLIGCEEFEEIDFGREWRRAVSEMSRELRDFRKLKGVYRRQRDAITVERSGSKVSISAEMDTDKLLDDVVPLIVEQMHLD